MPLARAAVIKSWRNMPSILARVRRVNTPERYNPSVREGKNRCLRALRRLAQLPVTRLLKT